MCRQTLCNFHILIQTDLNQTIQYAFVIINLGKSGNRLFCFRIFHTYIKETGESFHTVTLPKGTLLRDADAGGLRELGIMYSRVYQAYCCQFLRLFSSIFYSYWYPYRGGGVRLCVSHGLEPVWRMASGNQQF